MYKNKHGHEPSPPLPQDTPFVNREPIMASNGRVRQPVAEFIQRFGHNGIDPKYCQGPIYHKDGTVHNCHGQDLKRTPAVCVMVENNPRSNGLIAAAALCAGHRDMLLRNHGPDYAHITPIEEL